MTSSLVPPARTAPLTLGFLTFVPFGLGGEEPAKGLRHGLELFDLAEILGYDFGWVRVRHFETYLSSPLTFLSAVSQRTERIHLGTAVIPARYESPIRLAEDAATVDLLSGGRLELGLSTGLPHLAPVFDGVFGGAERDFSGETQDHIRRVREALAGEVLGIAEAPLMSVPAGSPLLLTPPNPGLNDRIWYGPGSEESAARSGRQGLNIQVSTLNTEETGRTFHEQQARQIRAYRAAFEESDAAKTRRPQVAAGRIVLPLLTPLTRPSTGRSSTGTSPARTPTAARRTRRSACASARCTSARLRRSSTNCWRMSRSPRQTPSRSPCPPSAAPSRIAVCSRPSRSTSLRTCDEAWLGPRRPSLSEG